MIEALTATSLFVKVCMLLTGSMIAGAAGAYLGRNLRSTIVNIGLFIAAIAGIFITPSVSATNIGGGIICLMIWSGVIGAMTAPALQYYAGSLGWHTVVGATAGTAGVMAIAGIIGALSGINFAWLGMVLGFALIGLIIVGLVGLFVRMSRQVRIAQAVVGMFTFAGYFLFDFWRLSKSENTWQAAIDLTINLYLDFVNFLLYLLQYLDENQKSAMIQDGTNVLVAASQAARPLLSTIIG